MHLATGLETSSLGATLFMTGSKHIFVRLAIAATLLLIAATGDFIATSVLDGQHGECNPLVRIEHKCDTTSGSRLAVVHRLAIPQSHNNPSSTTPQLKELPQLPFPVQALRVFSHETETSPSLLLTSSSLRC
jgi:hypothetical protein